MAEPTTTMGKCRWVVTVERSLVTQYRVTADSPEAAEAEALRLAAFEDNEDYDQEGERVLKCRLVVGGG